jgi:hypothetical protein
LDPEIWEVKSHFVGMGNPDRRICHDDITYMNIVAMMETRAYSMRDTIYCTPSDP